MDEKLEHRVSRMSRNVTLAITLAAASAFVGCDYGDRGVSQPQSYQQAQATPTPGARAGGHYYYGGGGYHGGTYQPVPQGSGYTAPKAVAGDNTAGTRAPSTTAPGTGASVAPAAPKAPAVAPAKAPTGGFGIGGGSAAS